MTDAKYRNTLKETNSRYHCTMLESTTGLQTCNILKNKTRHNDTKTLTHNLQTKH